MSHYMINLFNQFTLIDSGTNIGCLYERVIGIIYSELFNYLKLKKISYNFN